MRGLNYPNYAFQISDNSFSLQTGGGPAFLPVGFNSFNPSFRSSYNRNEYWIFIAAIKVAVQKVFPRSLQTHLLHKYHYLRLAGHFVDRGMDNTMPCEVYQQHMVNDLYILMKHCHD